VRTKSLANSEGKKKEKKKIEGLANFQEEAIQGGWKGGKGLGLGVRTISQ